ncbi:MAG: homoserine O-acetyltransferase [Flavisolibacter sp.]
MSLLYARMEKMKYFNFDGRFELESGKYLDGISIAYHTYGKLNEEKSNAIWICHALTANSDVMEWWPGVVGKGCVIDPEHHFIICANILGSCYGSTGPGSKNAASGKAYLHDFPLITIRDMVNAHRLLFDHLGLKNLYLLSGGSMGGYQALEWVVMQPELTDRLFLLATCARETAWGIAIHTAQRLAIEADATWKTDKIEAGKEGLKAARAIAMLTYRNYNTYKLTQDEPDLNKLDHFKASSYILHQGNKLAQRFHAYTYWTLSKAMDSHNLSRNRSNNVASVLQQIRQNTLIIGIENDLLCPIPEVKNLADNIPNSTFHEIDSIYGHDGFLTEHVRIAELVLEWMSKVKGIGD